ncbi:MAG TPA: hypothetical protein VHL09_05315 [Dehalococcoidia bacterium]|nr:hypothetical protein [Dehalococcoidia bacterium]
MAQHIFCNVNIALPRPVAPGVAVPVLRLADLEIRARARTGGT